jgi:hypothetical protein
MAGREPELRGLLLLFGATDRVITRFAVRAGRAIGWDAGGRQVADVPLQEPAVVRPAADTARGTWRTNIT